MRFPFVSFLAAFLIWIFLIVIFSGVIFTKSDILPISLTIDAAMVGEMEKEKKSAENFSTEKGDRKKIEEKFSAEKNQNAVQKKVTPLFAPLPKIPDDLRNETFASEAIARFHIAPDGSVTNVELIKHCSNPRLNQLLLRSLRNWKFVSNSQSYTQEIRVNFEVEE
jgi:TonB family protein